VTPWYIVTLSPTSGRLADHHAHPVVDEQAVADPRRPVDLDPVSARG
jgi:hypothetical protein